MATTTAKPPHKKATYDQVDASALILRDMLAADRTVLANERTFLAYLRTALAFLISGVSLLHFFDIRWMQVVGMSMIPLGPVVLVWGIWRYVRVRKSLKPLKR